MVKHLRHDGFQYLHAMTRRGECLGLKTAETQCHRLYKPPDFPSLFCTTSLLHLDRNVVSFLTTNSSGPASESAVLEFFRVWRADLGAVQSAEFLYRSTFSCFQLRSAGLAA